MASTWVMDQPPASSTMSWRSTIANGAARPDAMHILFVRRIGGTDNPKFDPAGYSMGLPGPYSHKRDTSGVLVATEKYAGSGGLDADGLSSSLAHEMGHYLGLYHTSEPDGATHDPLSDTPECLSGACDEPFLRNIMTSGRWLAGKALRHEFSSLLGKARSCAVILFVCRWRCRPTSHLWTNAALPVSRPQPAR